MNRLGWGVFRILLLTLAEFRLRYVCSGLLDTGSKAVMPATLFAGSVITQSGFYLISHSSGHHPDTKIFLLEDLILPACPARGCFVSYSRVYSPARQAARQDKQRSKTELYSDDSF